MGLERVARQCVFFILIFSTYVENFYLYIHVFFHCNLFHLHLFYWSIWTYIVDKCLVLQRSTLILECSLGKSDLTKPVFTVCVLFYFSYTFFIILIYVSFWGGIDVYISSTIQREKKVFFLLESECHSIVSDSLWPYRLYSPWHFLGQNTGVSSLSLLFPTQGLNTGVLHCRWILSQLSHKGNPRIMELVA